MAKAKGTATARLRRIPPCRSPSTDASRHTPRRPDREAIPSDAGRCQPFTRARQTAEIIAAVLGVKVELEAAFREQSFGIFAGQPYESLVGDAAYHDGPGGSGARRVASR